MFCGREPFKGLHDGRHVFYPGAPLVAVLHKVPGFIPDAFFDEPTGSRAFFKEMQQCACFQKVTEVKLLFAFNKPHPDARIR